MAARFVCIDRDTPLLLPPDMRDWVPANHLVHFILDAVDALDLRQVKVNTRGTGDKQYPPRMLLAALIYSYATGVFGSRRIESSTYDSVPMRVLTADTHPDHDTLCTFRRENQALLTESFVGVLQLAQQLKLLKFGQLTVAADGTKVQANASKHSAVSYARAGEMMEQLELEVQQLLAKAEAADSAPLREGLTIPEEITRRQERQAALARARAEIEARAHARYAAKLAEHKEKLAERAAKKESGQRVGGQEPKAPNPEPEAKDQYNFTDPESRIMKAGNGNHFEQSYNAQAAVEVESRLIVGQVEENPEGGSTGTKVYAAVEKTGHHRNVADLEIRSEPEAPPPGASVKEVMSHRLRTSEGKALYKLRQQTVEPIFGIIKSVLGFRQFHLRGREKVSLEWTLVGLAYNLKRLHRLSGGLKLALGT
jgi:transposase